MGDQFIIEAWVLLAIALLSIILRLYSKFKLGGWKGTTIDDGLIIAAGIFYTFEIGAAHFVVKVYQGMANNNVVPELRATLDSASPEWRYTINGSKTHIFGWFMYICLFWTLKCCWTLYYARLTRDVDGMDKRINLAWVQNGITFIAVVCMVLFKCWPLHRQWQINPDPGNRCYPGASKLQVIFVMVINTITDLYLMWIPVPILFKVRISLRRKISLFFLFSGGGIVIVFGILRCYTLVSVPATQPSVSGQWSVRESFVAILISNGPTIYSLFNHLKKEASKHRESSESTSYPLDSVETDGKTKQTKHSSSHRLSDRIIHFYPHSSGKQHDMDIGSQEAIITASEEKGEILEPQDGLANKTSDNQMLGKITVTKEWNIKRGDRDDRDSIDIAGKRYPDRPEWC